MSAFVVADQSIDEILSCAINMKFYAKYASGKPSEHVTLDNATEFGRMLLRENYRSVNHRYPALQANAEAEAARYQFTYRQASPGRAAKRLQCYQYQSCESDDWSETIAGVFFAEMVFNLCKCLPDFETTPWG